MPSGRVSDFGGEEPIAMEIDHHHHQRRIINAKDLEDTDHSASLPPLPPLCIYRIAEPTTPTVAEKLVDDDGCKTPTSEEHRIPAVWECPPAPKKKRIDKKCHLRSIGLEISKKRRESFKFLDISLSEMGILFSGCSGKIGKARDYR